MAPPLSQEQETLLKKIYYEDKMFFGRDKIFNQSIQKARYRDDRYKIFSNDKKLTKLIFDHPLANPQSQYLQKYLDIFKLM